MVLSTGIGSQMANHLKNTPSEDYSKIDITLKTDYFLTKYFIFLFCDQYHDLGEKAG